MPRWTTGFAVVAAGSPPLAYQWLKNGTALAGATTLSLTVTQSCRADAGQYSITVSNSAGSVTSPNATVRVLMPQKLSAPQPQPDGSVMLVCRDYDGGALGSADIPNFELSASADLATWAPVVSSIVLTNGSLAIRDASPANSSPRYYRVMEKP